MKPTHKWKCKKNKKLNVIDLNRAEFLYNFIFEIVLTSGYESKISAET